MRKKKNSKEVPTTPNIGAFNPADEATEGLQDPGGAHAKGFVADPPGSVPRPKAPSIPVAPPPPSADLPEPDRSAAEEGRS